MSSFSFDEQQNNIIQLKGTVTFYEAVRVMKAGIMIFKNKRTVCLDVVGIVNFDSSILSVLLAWRRFCFKNKIHLQINGKKTNIFLLIESCGLEKLFVFFD